MPLATHLPDAKVMACEQYEASALALAYRAKVAVAISGKIAGNTVEIAGDQGAQASFLDVLVYNELKDKLPSIIKPHRVLSARLANGNVMPALGYINLPFELDGQEFTHRVWKVENFSGLFLLGIDFFQERGWRKPEDFENYYIIGGKKVEFHPHPFAGEVDAVNVVTRKKMTVPPKSKGQDLHFVACLQGTEERELDDVKVGEQGSLRPNYIGIQGWPGLEVSNTVSPVYKGKRVRLKCKNRTDLPIIIPANTVVAIYSKASLVTTIDYDEFKAMKKEETPSDVHKEISEHLKKAELQPQQIDEILSVLFNRSNAFAMHPYKPGLNRLVEHRIDTGSALPIKSRPHMHSPAEEEKMSEGANPADVGKWYR